MIAFLVSGYAAGTMSDSHINAVLAAIGGALLFLSQRKIELLVSIAYIRPSELEIMDTISSKYGIIKKIFY